MSSRLLLFRIITAVISLTLLLVSLEIMARLLAPQWLTQRMIVLNPPLGEGGFGSDSGWKVDRKDGHFWRFTPHSEFDVTHIEYGVRAHIDDLGGRAVANSKGDNVVPFLGDSFTFGVGVADSETFASLLSTSVLPKRILNLGVPGTALNSQLTTVEVRHAELGLPKKYLFFFFLGNDFADLMPSRGPVNRHEIEISTSSEAYRSIAWRLNALVYANPLLRHSYFIQFVRRNILVVLNKNVLNQHLDPVFSIMDSRNVDYRLSAKVALQDQVDRLFQMQESMGFRALLVAIPSMYQTNSRLRNAKGVEYSIPQNALDPLLPNQILLKALERYRVPLVDPTQCIATYNFDGSLYYVQDNHFTRKGHKVLADCIREDVLKFLSDDSGYFR